MENIKMVDKKEQRVALVISFFITSLFLLTLIYVSVVGNSSRRYALSKTKIYLLKQEKQAFEVWQKNKVKGRILLHFSQHLPLKQVGVSSLRDLRRSSTLKQILTNDNYLFISTRIGFIRKIIAIVPTSYWPILTAKLSKSQVYNIYKNDYAEGWFDGLPITIMPENNLPAISETVVVNFSPSFFNYKKGDFQEITSRLKKYGIRYDLLTWEN